MPVNKLKEKQNRLLNSDRSYACDRAWTARLSASGNQLSSSGFVCGCCGDIGPIIAAGLLWTPFYRIGSWLLLGSIEAHPSAIYNHHLVISPDHVLKFPLKGLLFQVTAYLMLIVDGLGCWIVYWR